MASRTRSIIAAVKAKLAGINGAAGGYVHDLSQTGRVKVGRPGKSVTVPCAWVAIGTLESEHGPRLGRYKRTLLVDIEARTPTSVDSAEERGLAAADLLDDIITALEADRRMGGLVLDLKVSGMSVNGDEIQIPGMAVAFGQLEVYWEAVSGAGV